MQNHVICFRFRLDVGDGFAMPNRSASVDSANDHT